VFFLRILVIFEEKSVAAVKVSIGIIEQTLEFIKFHVIMLYFMLSNRIFVPFLIFLEILYLSKEQAVGSSFFQQHDVFVTVKIEVPPVSYRL